MGIQAWMIRSWPTLEWCLPVDNSVWPKWLHMSTHVREDRDPDGRLIGDTVWMAAINGKTVGAAWEWAELRPGVVTLMDPNSLISNVTFLTPERSLAEPLAATILLNRIAHALPWQDAVCTVLRALREHPEMANSIDEWTHVGTPGARAATGALVAA